MDSLLSTLISKFSKEFLVGLIVVIIVLFIGLLCFSYWAHVEIELFGKKIGVRPATEKSWVEGYLVNADDIELWKEFSSWMNYFNAPFTKTDKPHIDFKREFLLQEESSFNLIFIRSTDSVAYRDKVVNFLITLNGIFDKLTPEQVVLAQNRIKVKVICNTPEPDYSFFLSENKKGTEIALVYEYESCKDSLHGESANPKREILYLGKSKEYTRKWIELWRKEALSLNIFELLDRYNSDTENFSIGDCQGNI